MGMEHEPVLLAFITIIVQAQASVSPPQCNDCLEIIAKVNS